MTRQLKTGAANMNRTVLWAALPLLFLVAACGASDYYTGLGTSNLERGVHEPFTLEIDMLTQVQIAQVINTGTVDLSMKIKAHVTFTDGNETLTDPTECTLTFYGVEEYTRNFMEYPFLLKPENPVNIWTNVTCKRVGNYTFTFNWDVTPVMPADFPSGSSLSTPGGKATAKFMVGLAQDGLQFGWSLLIYILGGVGGGGGGVGAFLLYRRRSKHVRIRKPTVKLPLLHRNKQAKPVQPAKKADETFESWVKDMIDKPKRED